MNSSRSTSMWHGRRSARPAAVLALGLIAGTLSACGGSSGSSDSAAGGCDSPGVTASQVKVAIVAPLTGPSAPTFAGFKEGAEARFAAENAAGGVNGRKIVTVDADDAGDGAQQIVAARKAVQSEKVFGIVAASRVDTMYDYLKSQKVPVTGYPGQPAFAMDKNVFGFAGAAQTGFVSTALVERMIKAGATNVANLAHNSPGAINSAKGFAAAAQQKGLKVSVSQFDIPLGTFDATSIAIKMKNAGVDSVEAATLTDSSVSVLKALKAQGVTLKAINVAGIYDPKIAAQVSNLIQGAITTPVGTVPTELNTDATKKFVDTMAKYSPGANANVGFTPAGYVSADLFIRGLQGAGTCPSQTTFVDKLRTVSDYDGAGLLPTPANFASGQLPDGTPYGKCSWYVTYKGDAFVPDAAATCGQVFAFKG